MKKCCICKIPKPKSDFNKNKSKKDGYNNICKDCSKERSRRYYRENNLHHRKVIRRRNGEIRDDRRKHILSILDKCVDCGNPDIRVLEFDHCRGKKYKDISILVARGYSLKKLIDEIKKCDIVCANCHRIRTEERNPSYKGIAYKKK